MSSRSSALVDAAPRPQPGRRTVLLATSDPLVRAEATRLGAAAGCAVSWSGEADDVCRSWATAAAVLVGADLAGPLSLRGLPRRAGVHVVSSQRLGADHLRAAVGLAAESVVELPEAAAQLGDLLGDVADHQRPAGRVLGVVAGSGGVGASVLAVAVASVAARSGRAALAIDLDPRGAGLDLVAGHDVDGVGWDSLSVGHGRLSSTALRDSLAREHGPAVLGWSTASGREVPPAAVVGEAIAAARRGHDLVTVDSPSPQVWTWCDAVVLVVAGSVHGLAAARRVAAALPVGVPAGLAVRSARRAAWAQEATQTLSLPLWSVVADQRDLDAHLSAGLGPTRRSRGAVARSAGEILRMLGDA